VVTIANFREDQYPEVAGTRCITVYIPDDDAFLSLLAGLINLPGSEGNYQGSDENKIAALAQQWRDAYVQTDWTGCGVDVSIPIGAVMQYAAETPPTGWLICDGRERLIADYPALYAVIGDAWGTPPSGSDYFVLPDSYNRSPYGYKPADEGGTKAFASEHGAETHLLTASQIPSHTHDYATGAGSGSVGSAPVYSTGVFLDPKLQTGSAGGGNPHNNLHPVFVIPFIIYAGA